jgi:hypothetical protein
MEVPPPNNEGHLNGKRDFYFRCVAALLINLLGYWWPHWYASHIPPEGDSRVGLVFLFTFPFLIVTDVWATVSFKTAYRPQLLSAVLLVLIWLPALMLAFGIIHLALFN